MSDTDQEKPTVTYVILKNGVRFWHKEFNTHSTKLNYIVNIIRYLEKDMDRNEEHSPYTIGVK